VNTSVRKIANADLAVTLRGMGISAAEERSLDLHGQVQRCPNDELPRVHVPTEGPGRHDRLLAGPCGTDAHRPQEGRDRDGDVVAKERDVAGREVEDLQVRIREVVRKQPQAGENRRPAPAERVQVEDLDRERVTGLGTSTAIGLASG
jgi:hypothetical protein